LRGMAVDAGVRGCAEIRSPISEASGGHPMFCFGWDEWAPVLDSNCFNKFHSVLFGLESLAKPI
jgi:hypothetical protein